MDAKRSVVICTTNEFGVEVPADWDATKIEDHYNNRGGYCLDAVVKELADTLTRMENSGLPVCFCGHIKTVYVREADRGDETEWAINATIDSNGGAGA